MTVSRILLSALLLGLALSSFGLALTLIVLIVRFAKDLNEVLATWDYIHSAIGVGVVALVGWWVGHRQAERLPS